MHPANNNIDKGMIIKNGDFIGAMYEVESKNGMMLVYHGNGKEEESTSIQ